MNSEHLAWKIRRHSVEMNTHISKGSHIASKEKYDSTDIIAALYSGEALFNPKIPKLKNRDRIILSKLW